MVGCPGSGKSFVARQRLVAAGYKYVNMDELKSSQRCVEAVRSGLAAGLSVVVDNTNPDKKSRDRFLQAARTQGVACRCLVMATTSAHARHNNRVRHSPFTTLTCHVRACQSKNSKINHFHKSSVSFLICSTVNR